MSKVSLLTVKDLACSRDGEHFLFQDLNFELSSGELLQITGANGSGKSSLLLILAGLLTPTLGQVLYQNQSIQSVYANYVAQLGFLGHKLGIKSELTVLENIYFMPKLSSEISLDQVMAVLERFKLQTLADTLCLELSAGQRQRLALACLLLSTTRLWILDEPFTAIDAQGFYDIEMAIDHHCQQQGAVIMVSHQPLIKLGHKVKILNL